ncbi:MAG: CPBP family intramembrane glutamic endopeptidase, partial [Stackebrandtia sp.]
MSTRTKGLVWFLGLAFVPTWLYIFIAIAIDASLVNPVTQLGFALFPAFAAFITRRWVTREGFGDAGLRIRWRTAWPQYLAASMMPFALVVATMIIAAGLGLWSGDLSALDEAT